ncbi:autoinducer binding domain-containing protein [Cognatishimia maritima]|uniref:Regulatory protein, luxR family n=1 Tax=Cognatishimia maritima TaxID=870908 RepID=A0A1M5JKH5_9RHOB|nr:autoinducer binding domain-containing protein [Cognatishimia maritima]SHG41031.1 regulatory protein, luxR family [Cognatishimia maritima]
MDLYSLHDAPRSEELYASYLNDVCSSLGFDDAAYAGINPVGGTMHAYVTYREDWQHHYLHRGLQNLDPTIHSAMHSVAPVDWSRLKRTKDFKRIFSDAHDFGISERGITIPVRGPYGEFGMLSVTRNCDDGEWKKHRRNVIADLQSVAAHVHDHVMSSAPISRFLHHPQLSDRELEILQWIAAGKSQQDIADIINISNRTVEVHLRSARTKLFALTTAQAVGRAIGMSLIYPS